MKIDEILNVIKKLACSNGSYDRMYRDLMIAREYDPEGYAEAVEVLEGENFSGPLDLILFLES